MERRILGTISLVAVMLLATGCPTVIPGLSETQLNFSQCSGKGIVRGYSYLMEYDSGRHQISTNPGRGNFRIQSDDQSEMFNVTCTQSFALKKIVYCEVYFVSEGEFIEENLNFQVIKIDYTSSLAWLWNGNKNMGIIMPIL
ncbi:MAG: hypothetical protein LKK19_01135 [Bacteroidales bacterium]|jgi:hypothetical protein|nr:hypothetical protein [Bacteroidales bacterium]MCI2121291.1 hypothetical protein [Bacteroidales bacterium]MCI2145219.1 hypothetical protein [Bacteroidales bacterium]